MTTQTLGLVIFDCDGVLIDSEIIAGRVFGECLVEAGFATTVDEATSIGVGTNAITLAAAVQRRFGRPLPDDFFPRMRARIAVVFERELGAMAGVVTLLAALHVPCCVASNSHIDRVRHALGVTGLARFFEGRVFSATMVAQGKPAPDLFLLAAERLGVPPARCLVVEDSATGIAAAHAAGIRVVGFCGGSHCSADHAERLTAAGVERVFARMEDLAVFLAAGAMAPGPSPPARGPSACA